MGWLEDLGTNIKTYVEGKLSNYQAKLVSGTNIKTINSNSLLGSGNINITATPGLGAANFYSQTNLTLNGNNGDFFLASINTAQTMSLSNFTAGKYYFAFIKNTSAGAVLITFPSNALKPTGMSTFNLDAGLGVLVSLIYTGTDYLLHVSEEIS